jgi:hypothetical protein
VTIAPRPWCDGDSRSHNAELADLLVNVLAEFPTGRKSECTRTNVGLPQVRTIGVDQLSVEPTLPQ